MTNFRLDEQGLYEQFLNYLNDLGIAALSKIREVHGHFKNPGYDAELDVQIGDGNFTLFVESRRGEIYPRMVREILWRLKSLSQKAQRKNQIIPFLVANSLSDTAKQLLRDEKIGYFDSNGNFFLSAPGVLIHIDKGPPQKPKTSAKTIFKGRSAQVTHALLVKYQEWFNVRDLAELAQVSTATVSQVINELERLEYIAVRGTGPHKERRLSEPAALLDAWAKQITSVKPPQLHRYYVPSLMGEKLLTRLAQVFEAHNVEYAITQEAAAQRYSPFLTQVSQVRCRLILGEKNTIAAIDELKARVVNEGANLNVIEVKSSGDFLFRERVGDVWLASPVQTYLDLLRGEGRAKELAEHLRKEKIGF